MTSAAAPQPMPRKCPSSTEEMPKELVRLFTELPTRLFTTPAGVLRLIISIRIRHQSLYGCQETT